MNQLRFRVDLGKDGKSPTWELMSNHVKICEMSYVEMVDFLVQAQSSLRWEMERK